MSASTTPPGTRLGAFLVLGASLAAAAVGILLVHKGAQRVSRAPSSREEGAPTGPPLCVRATELFQAYDQNAIAADARYGGRWLEVNGDVRTVDPTSLGFSVVFLIHAPGQGIFLDRQGQEWLAEGGAPPNVVCAIDGGHRGGFAAARPHQAFTVRGRCRGLRTDPKVYKGKVVVLEDCRPVDSDTP